jgi:hypothetical protein
LVGLSRLAEQRERGRLVGQDQDVFAAVVPLRSLEMGGRARLLMTPQGVTQGECK